MDRQQYKEALLNPSFARAIGGKIKAVFFDIDGTLVPIGQKEMSLEIYSLLEGLRRKGIKVFISSGRGRSFIRNVRDFPFDGYITMNGALLTIGEEKVFSSTIEKDSALRIVRVCQQNSLPCVAFLSDHVGINLQSDRTAFVNHLIHVGPFPLVDLEKTVQENDIYQFTLYMSAEEEGEYFPGGLEGTSWPRWHPAIVDVTPGGVSKGLALEHAARYLGISADRTMAFGDAANDISMLEMAGIGVAMGNSASEVMASADYVTSKDTEGGINAALAHFGLLQSDLP